MGRRERKKAATRQALADAALRLFLERGYEHVSVKDVADAADVSTTTLFKHFTGKEALVFDRDFEVEARLVAAVRDREPGRSIPGALRDRLVQMAMPSADDGPDKAAFRKLVESTPVLKEYGRRMWMRHETALAHAIAADVDAPEDDLTCAALARFALGTAALGDGRDDPRPGIDSAFALLEHGWNAVHGNG
ncbi:TetR family transcriptional regulator [Streptomyces sp. SID3343]|nr:TetR family transcriptional regulator [Streptomyces sp. SID3343]